MDRKNLLIAGVLIGGIISYGVFIIMPGIAEILEDESLTSTYFNNSTPQATAVSIARLNLGSGGFEGDPIKSVHLTSDGKYWIVNMHVEGVKWAVTVDAKTWMSKKDGESFEGTTNTWRSLDELKAEYIADIQKSRNDSNIGRPSKVAMDGKEIWRVPVYKYNYEHNKWEQAEYVYVDVATGKSKNTWGDFDKEAGTDSWLTLKQVDDTINKMGYPGLLPFRDALRDLYPE